MYDSDLITALDNNQVRIGENKNLEYDWSNKNIEDLIVQMNFQLIRTNTETNIKDLESIFLKILELIFNDYRRTKNKTYIKLIYKLVAYTRDIIYGKGEYGLSHLLIITLYNFSNNHSCNMELKENIQYMVKNIINNLVHNLVHISNNEHPLGSWKDLKYILNAHVTSPLVRCYNCYEQNNDTLISHICNLIIAQLKEDETSNNPSLLAKWIPREKSKKFGWITPILAVKYYSEWIPDQQASNSHITKDKLNKAKRKCLTHFRQNISNINKKLNTVQINQCGNNWKNIDFEKNMTSITLRKQSKAFLNNNKKGILAIKRDENQDRIDCKNNFKRYMENCSNNKCTVKAKRVSIIDFVRDAIRLINLKNAFPSDFNKEEFKLEHDLLNAQWKANSICAKKLINCIAMIDTSLSMHDDKCEPLYAAIGLGIRIAENSKLGKRVLSFSADPSWINLDECPDFVSMVERITYAPWGTNTNFRGALDMILSMAIIKNIDPNEMKNINLIILSDMQIDYGMGRDDNTTMFEMMKGKYTSAGLETVYKKPYELPHIIFWNLRKTNGFPCISSNENTSMMSGNNAILLNNFSELGTDELIKSTPFTMLVKMLSNERYRHFDLYVDQLF